MDDYRDHPSEFELGSSQQVAAPDDTVAAIGTDERRMHVRAYNYWAALLDGRDFPSIEDLESGDVKDFSPHSVLLDFTCGRDNPAIPFIGGAIREECGLSDDTRTISDVPSRSLLSRLTDHYMQIIANRAPVGFEAEFANQRDETICYRGILMPFSSDGDTIDFIYGVINWKKDGTEGCADSPFRADVVADDVADDTAPANPVDAVLDLTEFVGEEADGVDPQALPIETASETQFGSLIGAFGPGRSKPHQDYVPVERQAPRFAQPAPRAYDFDPADFADPLDQPATGPMDDFALDAATPAFEADACLADRLVAARETAEAAKAGEGRTRAALYRALALAYDFALAAREDPSDYEELLADSGVKAQARAPMTPIVKLVFGIDTDKARLTEFAAALSFADRNAVERGGFARFIAGQPGGLKALVAAERQARRPAHAPEDRSEQARNRLRAAAPLTGADFADAGEFSLLIMRRAADGTLEPVALVTDEAIIDRAIRRTA